MDFTNEGVSGSVEANPGTLRRLRLGTPFSKMFFRVRIVSFYQFEHLGGGRVRIGELSRTRRRNVCRRTINNPAAASTGVSSARTGGSAHYTRLRAPEQPRVT